MKKKNAIISVLVITNLATALICFGLYFSMKIGKATLDEESHHLYMRAEQYSDFLFSTHKELSKQELLKKYDEIRELSELEKEGSHVQIGLLFFNFKDGKLVSVH
jgi:hypothetical protein